MVAERYLQLEVDRSSEFPNVFLDGEEIDEIALYKNEEWKEYEGFQSDILFDLITRPHNLNRIVSYSDISTALEYDGMLLSSIAKNINAQAQTARKRYFNSSNPVLSKYNLLAVKSEGLIVMPANIKGKVQLPTIQTNVDKVLEDFPKWREPYQAINQRFVVSEETGRMSRIVRNYLTEYLDSMIASNLVSRMGFSRQDVCATSSQLSAAARSAGVIIEIARLGSYGYELKDMRMVS